jgi:hypothetical protein
VQKSENISFELLELEMADLERFWRKTPLGPLGVNRFIESNWEDLNTSSTLLLPSSVNHSIRILLDYIGGI